MSIPENSSEPFHLKEGIIEKELTIPKKRGRKQKIVNIPECSICCEIYNKSLRAPIICSYEDCHFEACKTCIRTYLTSTTQEPHCMNCKKIYDDAFMFKNLNKSYYKTGFKDHRSKILFDIEVSKIPETIPAVENFLKAEDLSKENDLIYKDIAELENQISKLRGKSAENFTQIRILRRENNKNDEKRKFIMPCPSEDCRGFLSTGYKCEICKYFTCPNCLELIGTEKTAEHVCNPDCVKNAETIKKDTRACPSCGSRIYKIEGCSQIWCTSCHVAFDWNTGKIENGAIHNPHFFEWQRTGGAARIEGVNQNIAPVGDCAGRHRIWYTYRTNIQSYLERWHTIILNYDKQYNVYDKKSLPKDLDLFKNSKDNCLENIKNIRNLLNNIGRLNRSVEHVSNVIAREAQGRILNLDNHDQNRILYILKRISPEFFTDIIYKNSIQKKKLIDKYHIYELISTVGRDLFNKLQTDELYLKISNEIAFIKTFSEIEYHINNLIQNLKEKDAEFLEFTNYCNEQFMRVAKLYNERCYGFINKDEKIGKFEWGALKN